MIDWLHQYSGYVVLIGFFTGFCGVVLWAYRPANRDTLEKFRNIPFREGE